MAFDPRVYERKTDFQREPSLSDEKWIERFIAFLVTEGKKNATEDFARELPEYAKRVAPTYLVDRRDYVSPEEAAETDISYWESEE